VRSYDLDVSQEANPGGSSMASVATGLVAAAHLGPAMVVTAMATALAVALEAGAGTAVLVALAFGSGQLSVGWSNDWIDAARDTATARTDKPVARGAVAATTVARAAAVAAVLTVPFSLALGPAAGIAHLVAVAAAWSYNLGLKSTIWSWAPYALAFGLVPAVVVLALPGHPWPPVWLVGVGALLGTGAHLANVLPDLEDDRATGVRGLGHRLGATWSSVLAPCLLVAGSGLALFGPAGAAPSLAVPVLLATVLLAGGAAWAAVAGRRLLPLVVIAAIAAVDLVLVLVGASTRW
jgi:4-hydroxybenzoate polyprenyltransferase